MTKIRCFREMVKATGPDAANFGKNSKAIFTVMRSVWNLRRGSEEDAEMPIVELIHAKCSDRKLYPKSAAELSSLSSYVRRTKPSRPWLSQESS